MRMKDKYIRNLITHDIISTLSSQKEILQICLSKGWCINKYL